MKRQHPPCWDGSAPSGPCRGNAGLLSGQEFTPGGWHDGVSPTRQPGAGDTGRGGWHDTDSALHGGGAAVRAAPASNGSHRDWRERTPPPLWLVRSAVTPGHWGQERALSGRRWRWPRPRGDARAERSWGRSRRSGGGLRAGGTRLLPPPPWRRSRWTRCCATASSSGWVARAFCRLWGPSRAARRRQRRGAFPSIHSSVHPSLHPRPREQELRVGRARPRGLPGTRCSQPAKASRGSLEVWMWWLEYPVGPSAALQRWLQCGNYPAMNNINK